MFKVGLNLLSALARTGQPLMFFLHANTVRLPLAKGRVSPKTSL